MDDTLVSTSESFDEIIKKYDVKFDKKFKDNWTEEEKDYIFKNFLDETLYNAKIKPYVKEVLEELTNRGHELFIVTARNNNHCKNAERFTKEFILNNNIKISNFYFGQFKKSDVAKKINLDLMIDDDVRVYNNCMNDNIDCILFGDKIKDWNQVHEYIKQKEE